MKKIFLTLCAVFTFSLASYSQSQIFHLTGGQSWGHVVTLATDQTGGNDDARLLFSYRNKAKQWALGGQANTNRFSLWEDCGDGIYGSGFGTERFTVMPGGNVGIGTSNPRALFDVAGDISNGRLGSVLGRLPEGNDIGDGTLLGVRGYATQGVVFNTKSFAIEHSFYGEINSSINFFRGGDTHGGYITFNTNTNVEKMRITTDGNVGIGTTSPDPSFKLSVNGNIRSKEVKVEAGWADYVFKKDYQLKSLSDVEAYIAKNGHLPDIPSEAEVKKNGVNVGETESLLLKKIEELTLYLIEKNKEVKSQQAGLKAQADRNVELEARLAKLEALLTKPVGKE